MLITGDPRHQLRAGFIRSAFNGAFVLDEMLHTPADLEHIASFALTCEPRLKSGSVETNGFFRGGDIESTCARITEKVKGMLDSYGWTEPSKEKLFLWNTRLLRTQGAKFHHDAYNSSWRESLFWVYVLDADGVDFRLPNLDLNIPLKAGQLLVFDPLQPHGVVSRGAQEFSSRKLTRNVRQLYLAGDMAYPPEFWSGIGVEYRTVQLKSAGFLDVNEIMVMEQSGDLVNRNYS